MRCVQSAHSGWVWGSLQSGWHWNHSRDLPIGENGDVGVLLRERQRKFVWLEWKYYWRVGHRLVWLKYRGGLQENYPSEVSWPWRNCGLSVKGAFWGRDESKRLPFADLCPIMCAWGVGEREWNLMPKLGFRVYSPAVKSHQMLAILKYG